MMIQFKLPKYSHVHINLDEVFSKILKKPSIMHKKMIPLMKANVVFIGKTQTQIQNGRLEKSSFSSSANSQYFFAKILWIGPLVSSRLVELIDAEGNGVAQSKWLRGCPT